MLDATTVVRFYQPSIPLAEGQASVLRYDFSDPQSGKDLCDRKIVRAVQKLLQFSQKVAPIFPKSCSKVAPKTLKVAQKLPQNPKVAFNFLV